ncbi:hypothetical protein BC941DRAFT_424913 [Chlamydoabsidia padenii]|nr:hypothetical protein BC941DRAFT_424913 [Chlamydoabsidia padenii]
MQLTDFMIRVFPIVPIKKEPMLIPSLLLPYHSIYQCMMPAILIVSLPGPNTPTTFAASKSQSPSGAYLSSTITYTALSSVDFHFTLSYPSSNSIPLSRSRKS